MLLIIVARSRLDRYEELRRDFGDWGELKVILDRREGERRSPQEGTQAEGGDRRRVERRRRFTEPYRKLGWDVVDTDDTVS
jgi:hypothetical protein